MSKYYRLKDLQAGPVPAARSTIYAWIADGTFPKPTKLGERMVAWHSEDIEKWLSDRRHDGCAGKSE